MPYLTTLSEENGRPFEFRAADGGDKKHDFERIGRNVDDAARRVSVEEKRFHEEEE